MFELTKFGMLVRHPGDREAFGLWSLGEKKARDLNWGSLQHKAGM